MRITAAPFNGAAMSDASGRNASFACIEADVCTAPTLSHVDESGSLHFEQ